MKAVNSLVAILSIAALPAVAQQAPPPYAPFTIEEADFKAIRTWIDDMPTKFGRPLAGWFDHMEATAQLKAKAATEEKKPAAPPSQ